MSARELDLPAWRHRIVLAALATATVLIAVHQSQRVFADDHRVWLTVAACAAAATIATALSSAPWPVRVAGGALATLGGAVTGVLGAGGSLPSDLARVPTDGIAEVMAAVWPSPPIPAGVGAVAALGCLAAVAAVELVVRAGAVAALLPSLAFTGLVALLSAEAGAPPLWSLSAYVAAALALLLAQRGAPRSKVAYTYAGLVTAVAVAVPALLGGMVDAERYDPRREADTSSIPEAGISPLARLDEWRSRTPPAVVFDTTLPTERRWRLVGLTRYDGRTWLPADDYRRSSSDVGEVDPDVPVVDVEVVIGALDAIWLPALDVTVGVSAAVRIDGTRSALLPAEAPIAGTTYTLALQPVDVQPGVLGSARVGDSVASFVDGFELSPAVLQLATTITAGARTDYERAEALATYLREQYVLDFDSPPGHSIAVLELFLERSRRGRDEQFVAAYGLLATAVGLPVRIAVGFETALTDDGTATVATSDRVLAWPEVDFGELGWVAFDPVPASSEALPPSEGDGAIAPIDDDTAEPPPTTAAATTQTTVPEAVTADTVLADGGGELSTAAVGAGASIAVAAIVAAVYVATILLLKRRRRHRRRAAASTRERAVGAFRSGIDVLVDLGAAAPRSSTDRELVVAATKVAGPAEALHPVAAVATQAVFSPDDPSPDESERAWRTIEDFEAATAADVGRLRYLRSRVSTRSLRRGLRD